MDWARGRARPFPIGTGVLKEDGRTVITRLNSSVLQEMARLTRGAYFEASMGSGLLSMEITRIVGERDSNGFRLMNIPRYRLLLLLAFLSYIAQILIRSIKIRGLF